MRERPKCCRSDELRKGRGEKFWVGVVRLGWDEGKRDEEAEEEPGKERG